MKVRFSHIIVKCIGILLVFSELGFSLQNYNCEKPNLDQTTIDCCKVDVANPCDEECKIIPSEFNSDYYDLKKDSEEEILAKQDRAIPNHIFVFSPERQFRSKVIKNYSPPDQSYQLYIKLQNFRC